MAKKITTPAPTGITITRSGNKLTAKWAKPAQDKVSGQKWRWIVVTKDGKEHGYAATGMRGKTETSSAFTFPASDFYPGNNKTATKANTVDKIIFVLRNKAVSGSDGDKVVRKSYSIGYAKKPSASVSRDGTSLYLDASATDDGAKWCSRLRYRDVFRRVGTGTGATLKTPSGKSVHGRFTSTINQTAPWEYIAYVWAEGPHGKSDEVKVVRYVGVPAKPTTVKVARRGVGSYDVSWAYSTSGGWACDGFEIRYIDSGYGEPVPALGSWSVAKSGISSTSRTARTDLLGGVPNNKVRRFAVVSIHDDQPVMSDAAAYMDWGTPDAPSSLTIDFASASADPSTVEVGFSWPSGAGAGWTAQVFVDDASKPIGTVSYPVTSYTSTRTYPRSTGHKAAVRVGPKSGVWSTMVWSEPTAIVRFGMSNLRVSLREDLESVDLKWTNQAGATGATGITAAWATDPDAFISNRPPETADFDSSVLLNVDRQDHLIIKGLEKGNSYCFWVRKWAKTAESTLYGMWLSAMVPSLWGDDVAGAPLTLAAPVTDVHLSLSRTWVRKDSATVQAAWTWVAEDEDVIIGSSVMLYRHGGPYTNEGIVRTWTFSGDRSDAALDLAGLPTGAYDACVTVTNRTGGTSSIRTEGGQLAGFQEISVVDRPACALAPAESDPARLTDVQHDVTEEEAEAGALAWTEHVLVLPGPSFTCTATDGAQMSLTVKAQQDFSLSTPDGMARVHAGETVWSADVSSDTVTVSGAGLLDGCIYTAELVATDATSGMRSDVQTYTFRVDWERKATAPEVTVEVDVDALSATITADVPEELRGDTCTIYRVTDDIVVPIIENAQWGTPYTDPYAPYNASGDPLSYRASATTPYGSVAWSDGDYELVHLAARIDFAGDFIDLPYNLGISDTRSKDFEVRKYLGGSKRAFVSPAIDRSQSLSTDLVVGADDGKLPVLYALSRHAGTCMVRTPYGAAYVGVADVAMDMSYDSAKYAVSVDITETDANGEFGVEADDE